MRGISNIGNFFLPQRIQDLTPAREQSLLERSTSLDEAVAESVRAIIREVRTEGDDALRSLASRFDGAELTSIEVPRQAVREALAALDPELRNALERTRRNLESVQRAFLPTAQETSPEPGIVVGRRPDPLDRVGVYAPGGRANR